MSTRRMVRQLVFLDTQLTRPADCPKCESHRAYFRQLQIRSADEPMTTF